VHLFRHHLAASPWQRRPPVPCTTRRAQVLPTRWGCLEGGAWLAAVDWEGAAGPRRAPPRPPLLLDMGDARMTFEALPGADAAAFGHAPATVLPAPARPPPVAPPPAGAGAAAAALARFNVSGDAAYAARAQRRGDRGGPAALARHATPAASLATLPVKALGRADLLHRPLAAFVPAPQPPRVKLGRGAAAPRGRARAVAVACAAWDTTAWAFAWSVHPIRSPRILSHARAELPGPSQRKSGHSHIVHRREPDWLDRIALACMLTRQHPRARGVQAAQRRAAPAACRCAWLRWWAPAGRRSRRASATCSWPPSPRPTSGAWPAPASSRRPRVRAARLPPGPPGAQAGRRRRRGGERAP